MIRLRTPTLSRWTSPKSSVLALLAILASCSSSSNDPPPPAHQTSPAVTHQTKALDVTARDTTFVTRDHFMAGVEMQLAGEPFAQAMGRQLPGFSRDYVCPGPHDAAPSICSPSTYYDPALNNGVAGGKKGRIDLVGFATAVESYEYSKQPMNNIAFESGAGTSLLFGSVINSKGATGEAALANMRAWVQQMAAEANTTSSIVSTQASPANPMGWPGFWPTLQPFTSWNPAIKPTSASSGCTISSDDDPGAGGALLCDDYECDYTTLHLPDRVAQSNMTIGPGASGWAGWKEALWVLNYTQVLHDINEKAVSSVPPDQLANVGKPGNTVVAQGGAAGTFLGSSNIEGFQAGSFIQLLDNQAAQWLLELTTADGAKLSGFASLADALSYSDKSPLHWFPQAITVSEAPDASGFPRPAGYAITSSKSDLLDLAGLLGAYASTYALTDLGNTQVGGSQTVLPYFDGDPFPVQNQTPTGANTLHDRALAMMRVAIVNMARLHTDPASGTLVDSVTFSGATPSRGTTLSADSAAYALLSLRTARRALDSMLVLYSNTKPDTAQVPTPLDGFPPVQGLPFGARLDALIASLSNGFYDKLTTDDGHAYGGWNLQANAPADDGKQLDAHTAAIRGLLVAYLATGQTRYRDRAEKVYGRLESAFYDPSARVYRTSEGDTSNTVTFTPRRFGLLEGALRDVYELIALLPGRTTLPAILEDRVARLIKLVLNGWDDRDEDELVAWPKECAQVITGPDGLPLGLGGLQMAERVLSGESGSLADSTTTPDGGTVQRVRVTDRERDCVPEISAVGLPAALASSVTFTISPIQP